MKVKELNQSERPREKARQFGIQALANRDLLAILLGSGTRGCSALELADHILNEVEQVSNLRGLNIHDLMKFKGIKVAKAISLLAAVELSRRMSEDEMQIKKVRVEHPTHLLEWLKEKIGYDHQERFVVIFLNHSNYVLNHQILFTGSDQASVVSVKEIYRQAVIQGASKVIVAHNHPSGSLKPSMQDIQTTQALQEMGKVMGITFLDHLIVSKQGYCSLRAMKMID